MAVPKSLRKEVMRVNKRVLKNTIISFFVYPLVYYRKKKIHKMGPINKNWEKDLPWWYWYGNTSEHIGGDGSKPLDFDACWYGDKNWRKRNLIARIFGKTYITSLVWNVIRNGVWNLRFKLGAKWRGPVDPKTIRIYINVDEKGNQYPDALATTWCNKKIPGQREVEFRYLNSGARGYRISSTLPKGKGWYNKMEGTDNGAVLFKRRRFRELEK